MIGTTTELMGTELIGTELMGTDPLFWMNSLRAALSHRIFAVCVIIVFGAGNFPINIVR